jgi:hypothetical protein
MNINNYLRFIGKAAQYTKLNVILFFSSLRISHQNNFKISYEKLHHNQGVFSNENVTRGCHQDYLYLNIKQELKCIENFWKNHHL